MPLKRSNPPVFGACAHERQPRKRQARTGMILVLFAALFPVHRGREIMSAIVSSRPVIHIRTNH